MGQSTGFCFTSFATRSPFGSTLAPPANVSNGWKVDLHFALDMFHSCLSMSRELEEMEVHDRSAEKRKIGPGDLATLLGLSMYALLPVLPKLFLAAAGVALVLACLRQLPEDGEFSRAARAIIGTLSLYAGLAGHWYVWPAYLLVPLLMAVFLGISFGFRRDFLTAARAGRLGHVEWVVIALVAIVAAIALVGWVMLLQPDLSRQRAMLPQWPIVGLLAAGLTFSVINALLEEFVWRGILLDWLRTRIPPAAAVLVQAASFGAAHYMGFPSGLVGSGLAAVYGVMLGALALRAKGLGAPILAHVAADAVIFAVLAGMI